MKGSGFGRGEGLFVSLVSPCDCVGAQGCQESSRVSRHSSTAGGTPPTPPASRNAAQCAVQDVRRHRDVLLHENEQLSHKGREFDSLLQALESERDMNDALKSWGLLPLGSDSNWGLCFAEKCRRWTDSSGT